LHPPCHCLCLLLHQGCTCQLRQSHVSKLQSSVAQSSSQSQLKTALSNGSVQPRRELLRVTAVAFTVSCLIKQPMQYWLWAASFIVAL